MKARTKKGTRMISLLLTLLMLTGILSCGPFSLITSAGGGPVGDVIFNQPSHWTPGATVETISWSNTAIYHIYDIAYTPAASIAYNGYATDAHLVMRDNSISLYGYQTDPRMDYVFTDVYKLDDLAFTLTPSNMNFHSFSETGFLFNGKMTMIGGLQYYTGYAITLTCENPAGMMENTGTAANTATLRIYYIDGEEWNTLSFQPGSIATTRTLVATVKSGIKTLDNTPYRVSIELDHGTKAFKVYIDGTLRADVPSSAVPAGVGNGFGFYMGSYAHNCGILSRVNYEYVMASVEPLPGAAQATVNFIFKDGANETEIRGPESETGVPGNRYTIAPPRVIMYQGVKYVLTGSDRGAEVKTGITLVYRPDPENNVTNLYYTKATVIDTEGAPPPVKEAWVNGDSDIADVRAGDEIEYAITAYAPPAPPHAMLAAGSAGNANSTGWWTAPSDSHGVRKNEIKYISFKNLTPAEFDDLQLLGSWYSATVDVSWFASTDDTNDVIAWVLDDHLYIGGIGGVYLSDGANQFCNFTMLESIDFEYLYTDYATDMNNMFENCGRLKTMDLSGFDTSKVTDMHYMFESCGSLETLNINSFDTSKVTDMNYMFGWCDSLSALDLSSFNTSKVVKFNSMFEGCSSLKELDLRNFDTSGADDMSCMFYWCSDLEDLNLTSFDTSGVTDMTDMFADCESLEYLELSNFDTSSVTSAHNMFSGCSSLISTKSEPFQVNHFNVSNILQFQGMFDGCEAFEYIDLCQWEIGAAEDFAVSYLSSINMMFQNCVNLKELHLESALLDNAIRFEDVFKGAFDDVTGAAGVFVGNASKTWIEDNASTLALTPGSYVLITPDDGDPEWHSGCNDRVRQPDAPISWTLGYTPPKHPAPDGYVIITDVIPDGLNIDESSITGEKTVAFSGTETETVWMIASQQITWQMPAELLPATVSVKVKVAGAPLIGDVFDNKAEVEYKGETQYTNVVSHTFASDYFVVREEYYLHNGAPTEIRIAEDYEVRIAGGSHTVRGLISPQAEMYVYVGYDTGGGFTASLPPAITSGETIKLYYKTVMVNVTVHFADQAGTPIGSSPYYVVESVVPGKDFFIPNRYFDSIGSLTYYAFAETNLGAGPAPGSSPGYPGSPALSNVTTDKHITLYFAARDAVTVRFAELGNPSHILRGDETYLFTGSFSPPTALKADIRVDDLGEQVYHYSDEYLIGSVSGLGFPGSQSSSSLITLFFETEYSITEMFHSDGSNNSITVLSPDISTSIHGGGLFTGSPPATISYGGYTWTYKGFRIGNDEAPLVTEETLSFIVMEEKTIIYVYERENSGGGNTGDNGGDTTDNKEDPPPTVPPTEPPVTTPPGETIPEEPDIDGNGSSTPPIPHDNGNTLVQQDDYVYIEYDRNGAPLGEWRWDKELMEWIFEEYPPDTGLPQTGDNGTLSSMMFILLDLSLIVIGFTVVKLISKHKAYHRQTGRMKP